MKQKIAKRKNDSVSRRNFLRSGGSAVVAARFFSAFGISPGFASLPSEPVYVCPPCGQECDKLTFDKAGTCPVCGMNLITSNERDNMIAAAAKANNSPLAGIWAGTYFLGSEHTAVRLYFTGTAQGLKGTVDLPGQNGGFNLVSDKIADDGFSGEISYIGKKTIFEAHRNGNRLNGTVMVNDRPGKLELVRLASVDLSSMRPWEGMYRAGARTFLLESLNEIYPCSAVELPSGKIRSLFAVAKTEFIAGPTLLEALPVKERYTLAQSLNGTRKVTIAGDRGLLSATRVPLRDEEVKFRNGDVTLAGTLILPVTRGPHPAIIFMHGSGGSPRVSYFGFGYWLASRGIAVLKYDKRGSGQSTGSFTTYEDLAEDAVAGARFLQNHADINPGKIGFWGISEGGWTASEAASRFSDAAFAIVVSGGGLSPAAGEMFDSEDQLRSDGRFSEADIQEALSFQRARDRYMQKGEGWDEYSALLKIALTKPWYNYPTTDLFGAAKPDSPFWRTKARTYFYDPLPALTRLHCPFLALRGALDDPRGGKLAFAAMKQGLAKAGNKDVTMRMIPGANHELFEAGGNSEDLPRSKRFAPTVLPLMTRWLEARTTRK